MKIITTEDGSCSLYDQQRELHYRSHQGARSESTHVFLQGTGIIARSPPWEVLELGFGGGFNFLNTAESFLSLHAEGDAPALLSYHVVEVAPIAPALLDQPGYATWSERAGLRVLVQSALAAVQGPDAPWETTHTYTEGRCQIELHLVRMAWQKAQLPPLQVMAYYHDPFGPNDNPPCWEPDCFAWAHDHMAPDGIMATYAAASRVRKAMIQAGWHVAKAPGSGRKREMTLASPTPEPLAGHKLIPRAKYLTSDEAAGTP